MIGPGSRVVKPSFRSGPVTACAQARGGGPMTPARTPPRPAAAGAEPPAKKAGAGRGPRPAFLAAGGSPVHAFVRGSRGAAAISLALGVSALITASLLGFDLYSRIEAGANAGRMAAVMAEYVSREAAPDADQLDALAQYLHERDLGAPADVAYVISVLRKPAGTDPATVSWVDTIRSGETAATGEVAGSCGEFGAEGGAASLPAGFAMADREVAVIVEVCARLRREGSFTGRFITGDVYRLSALPAHDPDLASAKPDRPEPESDSDSDSDDDSTAFLFTAPPAAAPFDGGLRMRHGQAA